MADDDAFDHFAAPQTRPDELGEDAPPPPPNGAFHLLTPRAQQRRVDMLRAHAADAIAAAEAEALQRARRVPQYDTPYPTRLGGRPADGEDINARRLEKFNRRTNPVNPVIRRMAEEQLAADQQGLRAGSSVSSPAEATQARLAEARARQNAAASAENTAELFSRLGHVTSPETRQILFQLVRNVLQEPREAGKRVLKESNARLSVTVFADPAAVATLRRLGFQRQPPPAALWQLPLLADPPSHAAQLNQLCLAYEALARVNQGAAAAAAAAPAAPPPPTPRPSADLLTWLRVHGFSSSLPELQRLGVSDTANLALVDDEALCSMGLAQDARRRFVLAAQQALPPPPSVEPPSDITCPISGEVMRDPVIDLAGHTYERDSIASWFAQCVANDQRLTDPNSGTVLEDDTLVPNVVIRRQASEWRERAASRAGRGDAPRPLPRPPPPPAPPAPPAAPPPLPPAPFAHAAATDLQAEEDAMLAAALAASLESLDDAPPSEHVQHAMDASDVSGGGEFASVAAAQLRAMGFDDDVFIARALRASNGDVGQAVVWLTSGTAR